MIPGASFWSAAFCVAALLAAPASHLQAQQSASVTRTVVAGRVIDAATREGVSQAELVAIGTGALADTVRTRSAADGAWQLALAGAGSYRLHVRALGHAPGDVRIMAATSTAPLIITLRAVPLSLDAVVVSAARREQRLGDAVVATELVSRREIQESGATDVAAALLDRTGLQLDAGTPTGAGVQMQGFGAQRVLVLLDGQPMVGRVNGNFDLTRLPTSTVQRIEVVQGPQSTLFGSDAIGGVVNIITRAPADSRLAADVHAIMGSHARRDASATLSGTTGSLGYVADGGYRHLDLTPGFANDDAALSREWDGMVKLSWRRDAALSFTANALGTGETQRYQAGQFYQFADNTQWGARLGARWSSGLQHLAPLLYYSRFEHLSRRSLTPRPVSDSGALDVQELAKVDLAYSGRLFGTTVDGGIELRRDRITADRVPGGTRSLDAVEPYAQVTLTRGALSLVPGARVSWSEAWGNTITPRVAALYRPRAELAIRASVARGFRAPDFKELYLDFVNDAVGYAVRGNPTLRPESSINSSFGVEWAGTRFYARGTLYRNWFTNFIETPAADSTGTFTYQNVLDGRTGGVELAAAMTVGALRVEGGYAFLHTRDTGTDTPLLGSPAHSGRLSLGYVLPVGPRVNLIGLYTGRTPVARDDTTHAITSERAALTRVNVRVVQRLPRDLSLLVAADNVFNEQPASAWPGFTGRQLSVGLTWQPSTLLPH